MNEKNLGFRQRHMLNFVRNYSQGDRSRFFHIARDSRTRRIALSLVKRNLIRVVNDCYECWVIALP